jgi:hypothetical protein
MQANSKKWYQMWWVWLLAVVFLYAVGKASKDENCGCSDDSIVQTQRSLGVSRERAIQMCCETQEYIKKNNLDN